VLYLSIASFILAATLQSEFLRNYYIIVANKTARKNISMAASILTARY